jgi:predicted permease
LPAIGMRRVDVRASMATRGSDAASGRLRYGLIAGEVALTIVLLTTAGLLIRTLVYLETLPPGFNPVNVMTAKASLDDARYNAREPFLRLLDRSVTAMRAIPGVEAAAVGLNVPYERALNYNMQIADGAEISQWHMTDLVYVTPGYFAALEIPLQAGRTFQDSDTPSSQFVAIVNASFARAYVGRANAVGRHLRSDGNRIEVVGIVGDVVASPGFSPGPMTSEPTVYVPATQMPTQLVNLSHVWFQPSWIVRTKGRVAGGSVASVTRQMQQALASADPNLPISGFYSMNDVLADVMLLRRVEAGLLTTLAGLALMLSAIGIYGLVSSLVNQRTREFGIRMALGCTLQGAMLEASRAGFAATSAGVAAGLLMSWSAVRVVRSQLFGIPAHDPWTMAGVTALLVLVAAIASMLPTFRIARIDPAQTLRAQ